MKDNKFNHIWFCIAVVQCCISAFVFGEVGGIANLIAASAGFFSYTVTTIAFYRRRNIQPLLNR